MCTEVYGGYKNLASKIRSREQEDMRDLEAISLAGEAIDDIRGEKQSCLEVVIARGLELR